MSLPVIHSIKESHINHPPHHKYSIDVHKRLQVNDTSSTLPEIHHEIFDVNCSSCGEMRHQLFISVTFMGLPWITNAFAVRGLKCKGYKIDISYTVQINPYVIYNKNIISSLDQKKIYPILITNSQNWYSLGTYTSVHFCLSLRQYNIASIDKNMHGFVRRWGI